VKTVGSIIGGAVKVLRTVAVWVVVACFVYMTLAVLAQVFGRYVFNYSISWTEETAKFAQIWVVLIGAGITMRRGLHVAVDVLATMLPTNLARVLMVVVAAGCLWFLGVVIYGSLPLIELGWKYETSPVLQIPMWIIYLCLPLGAFYFGVEIILSVIARWDRPSGNLPDTKIETAS
jgi:TRAP-type C4-dicarboxylate transport system permease small subunit